MIIGSDYKSLDDKGRVVIPAKWREDICPLNSEGGYSPVILQYKEKRLMLWRMEDWLKSTAPMEELQYCESICPDAAGRILIPKHLASLAGLNGEVYYKGTGHHLEIWDSKAHIHV